MSLTIGERIKNRRKELRRSAEWLASQVGCSQSTISQYERNVRTPNIETLMNIAKSLNCTVRDLASKELLDELTNTAKIKLFHTFIEEEQHFSSIIDEQINHLNFQANLRDEFVKNNILEKIRKHENLDRLYSVLASAFTLNADGLDKAIQYLIDLNKIYDYRETGVRLTARHIDMINQEVTQCPEDAQQTDQACSPGSDQTGAGNADIKPE